MLKKPKKRSVPAAPAQPIAVSTRAEADAATIEYANARRMCERLQSEFDKAVEHLFGVFSPEYAEHEAVAKSREVAVVAYARRALDEINLGKPKPAKSLRLGFGRVKFTREGDRVVFRAKVDDLLDNLRKFRLRHLIRQRDYFETDDLRTIDAELHERIGFSIEPTPESGRIDLDHHSLATLPEFGRS
jgi:phage host-nuclease inhibitor protein Gam